MGLEPDRRSPASSPVTALRARQAHGRWTSGGEDAGAIACTTANGEAIIFWSKTDGDFVGVVRRADGDSEALYDWWKTNAPFISP